MISKYKQLAALQAQVEELENEIKRDNAPVRIGGVAMQVNGTRKLCRGRCVWNRNRKRLDWIPAIKVIVVEVMK